MQNIYCPGYYPCIISWAGNKLGDKMSNKGGNKSESGTEQNIHLNETQLQRNKFLFLAYNNMTA